MLAAVTNTVEDQLLTIKNFIETHKDHSVVTHLVHLQNHLALLSNRIQQAFVAPLMAAVQKVSSLT